MRYAYGLSTALLTGGAVLSLLTGYPAGAQTAQNEQDAIARVMPRAGAPASFADLTAQLQPAVVNISTRGRVVVQPNEAAQFFGIGPQVRQAGALGSGFVISADGYVVTNNHVITLDQRRAADQILVKLANGKEYPATVVGRDPYSDVALLKITPDKPLPFVKLGESGKSRVGDWVVVIGNPFGFEGSVTAGIISSVNRNTGSGAYDHYIQTDASINSGNSGGPMFAMNGDVIGINTWIASPSGGNIGLGFAIPSDVAKPVIEALKTGKPIERGYLGVQLTPIDADMADALGLPRDKGELVGSVVPGRGAAEAGIMPNDVILSIDGKTVTPDQTATYILFNTPPGKRVTIDLLRAGKQRTVTATVGRRPTDDQLAPQMIGPDDMLKNRGDRPRSVDPAAQQNLIENVLGVAVQEITPEISPRLGVPPTTQGLVIVGVDSGSDAATKGLKPLVMIMQANGRPVPTADALRTVLREALAAKRNAVQLMLQVPGGQPVFMAVRLNTDN